MTDVAVFDLDDTLYAERDYVMSGFAAVQSFLVADGPAGRWHDFAGRATSIFDEGQRTRIFDRALAECGVVDTGLVNRMVAHYRSHRPRIEPYPDAFPVLRHLRDEGWQLALITDGFLEAQKQKVAALNLQAVVPFVVYSDELGRGCWKPHAAPYQTVMAHYGVPGSRCIYVADNPKKDFIGARALGWRTVRVRCPGAEHAASEPAAGYGPDSEVDSLSLVPDVLTTLMACK